MKKKSKPKDPKVVGLARRSQHRLAKDPVDSLKLLQGLGVEGDCHCGETVKHRSRVRKDPSQPNLRQVHLVHCELFAELKEKGFDVNPADMGENICTSGLDLLALPAGTVLELGEEAQITLTGLRNPCQQLNDWMPGLMQAVLDRDEEGKLIRLAGVMAVVLSSGLVNLGDEIKVNLPPKPHQALEPV